MYTNRATLLPIYITGNKRESSEVAEKCDKCDTTRAPGKKKFGVHTVIH